MTSGFVIGGGHFRAHGLGVRGVFVMERISRNKSLGQSQKLKLDVAKVATPKDNMLVLSPSRVNSLDNLKEKYIAMAVHLALHHNSIYLKLVFWYNSIGRCVGCKYRRFYLRRRHGNYHLDLPNNQA